MIGRHRTRYHPVPKLASRIPNDQLSRRPVQVQIENDTLVPFRALRSFL